MSSKILTDEQATLVSKARKRVDVYRNNKGEINLSCQDCAITYMYKLIEIIDDLEFELDQLNK